LPALRERHPDAEGDRPAVGLARDYRELPERRRPAGHARGGNCSGRQGGGWLLFFGSHSSRIVCSGTSDLTDRCPPFSLVAGLIAQRQALLDHAIAPD
jgi:hypothetical protein